MLSQAVSLDCIVHCRIIDKVILILLIAAACAGCGPSNNSPSAGGAGGTAGTTGTNSTTAPTAAALQTFYATGGQTRPTVSVTIDYKTTFHFVIDEGHGSKLTEDANCAYHSSGSGKGFLEVGNLTSGYPYLHYPPGDYTITCTGHTQMVDVSGANPPKECGGSSSGSETLGIYLGSAPGLPRAGAGKSRPANTTLDCDATVDFPIPQGLMDPIASFPCSSAGCLPTYGSTIDAQYSGDLSQLAAEYVKKLQKQNRPGSSFDVTVHANYDMHAVFGPAVTAGGIPPVDIQCSQSGGSSIGCQGQTLGEDAPVTGTGLYLHYASDRAPGRRGASAIATADARMIGGWTLNVHHAYDPTARTLYLGDGRRRSQWQLGDAPKYQDNYLLTAEDGSEVFVFDPTGRHLKTLKPVTGALKYVFGYDAAGSLVSIADGAGNKTLIRRDGSEHATAIVSPYSQTTALSMDGNGFLNGVKNPRGDAAKFTYDESGLIVSRADANNNVFRYSYDPAGRLISESDPAGGSWSLSRSDINSGYGVTMTSAMGQKKSFQVGSPTFPGEQFSTTWSNGLKATTAKAQKDGQLTMNTALPDGASQALNLGPDPRWGLQAPIPLSGRLSRGSRILATSASRTVDLSAVGNPFSLAKQTDTATLNGHTYTSVFTAASGTYVNTTPAKRTSTTMLDSLGRVVGVQVGTLLAVRNTYDANGRLATVTQGERAFTFAYDPQGFLASITDPMKLTTSYTHDGAGRVLTITKPDGRTVTYGYDANGNLQSVAPPGRAAHGFSYSPVNLAVAYTPPGAPKNGRISYAYDADRHLTTVTRPDGPAVKIGYDSAGRLSSIATPSATANYTYDSGTGKLSGASVSGGESIVYGYDASLQTSSKWTGKVAGSTAHSFDNDFRIASESIVSGKAVDFTYDEDGLLSSAGSLSIRRDAADGLVAGTALGGAADSLTYDPYGAISEYAASYNGSPLFSLSITHDALGRVVTKAETIDGQRNLFEYAYDTSGRITSVKQNGTLASSYVYDGNSNRATLTNRAGTLSATYDAQDAILTYGPDSYAYGSNGELMSDSVGAKVTSYQYDLLGNLVGVTMPSGDKISYIIDAQNHRVGKQVNGVLKLGFLYEGRRVVAQLDGNNQVVSQFVYATGARTPDYMINGDITYRIFSDQLGSPRLVVNTKTGAIAEELAYDEFGNVIHDSNAGFQPFGFAGGLADQDTHLLRFGSRDYNPAIGRWTAKDPILFAGGDSNLYGYVMMDPVNFTDTRGLSPNPFTAIADWYDGLTSAVQGDLNSWASQLWSWAQIKQRCVCPVNVDGGEGLTASQIAAETALHVGIEAGGDLGAVAAEGGEMTGASTLGALLSGMGDFVEGYMAMQLNQDRLNAASCP